MAQYECEVPILVVNGQSVADVPPSALDSGDEEGLQYEDSGQRLGGFEGWVNGEQVRLLAEIKAGHTTGLTALVTLRTSPEKMVKWHNNGWKGKQLKVKKLKSEKARLHKDELVGYEE
jgi:hypothetical protein